MTMAAKEDSAFEAMDRMYRLQRYFYDLTRKFYLLGRDQLLNEMEVRPGEYVLEAGCGTARNLIVLANRCPEGRYYGLDASGAMLETAREKAAAARVQNVVLTAALADDFMYGGTFGLDRPFDKIFFSYSISMIPVWRECIENALHNLGPGGKLFIVDFYDQAELPPAFRRFLKWWLGKFHVRYWDDLIPFLLALSETGNYKVEIKPLFRRYSFIAAIEKFD